jgi:shikimate dehydrogenase
LGTGGAAKAIAYVLKKLNIDYQFVSRKPQKNTLTYELLDKQTIKNNSLIINATPLGMFPNTDTCPPIDYTAIGNGHFLFDLVYNPEETLFLKKGKEKGAKVQNGYEMLVYQAEEAWKIFSIKN